MSAARRELHLNAFLMEAGHHEAAWRLPESNPRADFDLAHWIELAQLAETRSSTRCSSPTVRRSPAAVSFVRPDSSSR